MQVPFEYAQGRLSTPLKYASLRDRTLGFAGMIPMRMTMDLGVYYGSALRLLMATLAAVAATAILAGVGANPTAAAMVFLVLVVWSSTQAGRWLSLYVAVVCALGFDYFFLPPVRSFQLAGGEAWLVMASYLASCVVVGRVAERARRQTRQAEQRREDVERLYELSQEMMLHDDAAGLIQDLPRLIHRIFALDGVVLYVCDQDRFYGSTANVPVSVQASLQSIMQGQNPTVALDSGYHTIALTLGMRPVGALGWRPALLSREVAAAVSAQVAIVLARSIAIEQSARIEAAREGERLRAALDRLADARTAHAVDVDSCRSDHAARGAGTGRSRAAGPGVDRGRGGFAARSADWRSRGDGGDRRQRGAGA